MLDYRGRPATGPSTATPLRVEVHIGPKPALLRFRPDRPFSFEPVAPDRLSFECLGKWIQPLSRRQAGDGSLGVFHPKASMTLQPGPPFELGNGQTVVSGTAFNFRSIHIPEGVTVTVRSKRRIQLRASGTVRIDGVLKLDMPAAEHRAEPMDLRRPATICDYAPVTLMAAGLVQVTGSIQRTSDLSEPV